MQTFIGSILTELSTLLSKITWSSCKNVVQCDNEYPFTHVFLSLLSSFDHKILYQLIKIN